MIKLRAPATTAALLALAAGCGHITNAPIEEDSTFLAALPEQARQALLSPDDATSAAPSSTELRIVPVELPWSTTARSSHASAARSQSVSTVVDFEGTANPDDVGIGLDSAIDLPGVRPTGADGQVTTPDHDVHVGVAPLDRPVARLAPITQAAEAADALGVALGEVFDVANAVRATPPDASDPDFRGWEDLSWHGRPVDVGIEGEGMEFAWEMAGSGADPFLAGWHAGEPTMATGAGGFTFDQGAWARTFGLTATGVVDVEYDNRAGVDLDLELTDLAFPDTGSGCASGPVGAALVQLGPAQRYHRDGADGDYQLVTRRGAGCIDTAESGVRVRWTGGEGRADARITFSDGRVWAWSQCWSGTFDAAEPAWERLTVEAGDATGSVLVERGAVEACVFPSFGEVDADIRGR